MTNQPAPTGIEQRAIEYLESQGMKRGRLSDDPDDEPYEMLNRRFDNTVRRLTQFAAREHASICERLAAAERLLAEFQEDAETNIANLADCGDPHSECPLQDAYKDWSTAGIVRRAAEYRKKYPADKEGGE